jgi:phosphonate transport system substrate-binding protein
VHKLAGFVPADDQSLLPFAEISYALDLQRAQSARWVDAKAKQARIDRLNGDFEQLKLQLAEGAKRAATR